MAILTIVLRWVFERKSSSYVFDEFQQRKSFNQENELNDEMGHASPN